MARKRILDLFCGEGGAALGYHAAGFEVVGVDINPMPKFPFEFIRGDAIEYLREHGHEFDAVHASPPCLKHSTITPLWAKENHLDLIPDTRTLLEKLSVPWVMENVVGSGLRRDLVLCGTMFGLKSYRHRIFETPLSMVAPIHDTHTQPVWFPYDKREPTYGQPYQEGWMIPVYGHNAPAAYQFLAMGVKRGQMSRAALCQSIPPAFAEYIGKQIMTELVK